MPTCKLCKVKCSEREHCPRCFQYSENVKLRRLDKSCPPTKESDFHYLKETGIPLVFSNCAAISRNMSETAVASPKRHVASPSTDCEMTAIKQLLDTINRGLQESVETHRKATGELQVGLEHCYIGINDLNSRFTALESVVQEAYEEYSQFRAENNQLKAEVGDLKLKVNRWGQETRNSTIEEYGAPPPPIEKPPLVVSEIGVTSSSSEDGVRGEESRLRTRVGSVIRRRHPEELLGRRRLKRDLNAVSLAGPITAPNSEPLTLDPRQLSTATRLMKREDLLKILCECRARLLVRKKEGGSVVTVYRVEDVNPLLSGRLSTMAGENGDTVIQEKTFSNGAPVLVARRDSWAVGGRGGANGGPPKEEEDEEMQCGLGGFKPPWIQLFASKQAFLVTFCITWVLQGMYYTYFVSVITTIEKLFRLQSKVTGFIMSATEIGQIGSSLLLTYYGGHGHRPKWIAWGMVLFATCSFTCSLPHFIFGQQMMANGTSVADLPEVCLSSPLNGTLDAGPCKVEYMDQQSKITNLVLAIFFVSLLGVGMGQTAVYTLGIPYIDDNVASRESPLYFAITIGVRILGPALGFILGSLCTRLYVDLTADVQITPRDLKWVGAWWLGLVLIASLLMLASIAMFSFPKRLSTCKSIAPLKKQARVASRNNPSLRDFPKAVRRLMKNDILMCRTASSVLHILPIAGLYTFLPKYLESQFRLTAHDANMVSGVGGILVMGLGIILSGVFILRVKPNARFVAAWIAFTAVIYACGMGILMFVGCPMNDFAGLNREGSVSRFEPVCQTNCTCDENKFSPICGQDGRTYYSACHAGCHNVTIVDGIVTEYSGCGCMDDGGGGGGELYVAKEGYCKLDCNNFVWYILLFSLFVFIHSTSEVGSMLLILRCVDPRDKAMALGLIQFAIGLFGNVPCPIVYGAVVDSACLIWDETCQKKGACKLYDENFFRKFYHGTTGAILLCAFLVDIIVWYKAGSINFVDEQVTTQVTEEELNPFTEKSRSETSVRN